MKDFIFCTNVLSSDLVKLSFIFSIELRVSLAFVVNGVDWSKWAALLTERSIDVFMPAVLFFTNQS